MQKSKITKKILSIVMFLSLVTIVIINYINMNNKYKVFTVMQDKAVLSLMKTIHALERETAKQYFSVASILQTDKEFMQLLQMQELEKINHILNKNFQTLRKADIHFKHLHFYDKNGSMLLAYHVSKITGKRDVFNLMNHPVLLKSYETQKDEKGFIHVGQKFFYSFVVPLLVDGNIVAFIEFAIDIDFNTKIVAKSGHYKYAYYINTDVGNTDLHANSNLGLLVNNNSNLFKELNMTQEFIYEYANLGKEYKHKNKYYLIYQLNVENMYQKDFAQLILLHDVTTEINENKNYLYTLGGTSSFILLLFFIILFFYINKLSATITYKEQQLQSLLDSSENFLLVYEQQMITQANQSFFNFFDVKDLHEFHTFYHQLEAHFVDDETLYQYNTNNPVHWSFQFQENSQMEYIVALRDVKSNKINYFKIEFNKLNEDMSSQLLTFTNITALYLNAKQDKHKANHDQLTGLYNREYFHTIVHETIQKNKILSLLLFDIDHFKNVNDTYGHNTGDIILQEFSQIINNNIKHRDILFRWGGEEFIVLLPDTKVEDAFILAEHIRLIVAEYPFSEVKHLECSIGIAFYHQHASAISFVEEADVALYEAKETGRNKSVIYQADNNV